MDPVSFFTILVWLAVAKGAVLMVEDAAYGVRGKQSPRQRERAAHQAAERAAVAAGQPAPPPPGGAWGRSKAAVGGYLAGVAEDATAKARARKRRAQARAAGTQAVDGVFVDLTDDDGFHADCDVCGWSSRRYRLEPNALAAGREHTRTEHPDLYHPDPEPQPAQPQPQPQPAQPQPAQPHPAGPADGNTHEAGAGPVEPVTELGETPPGGRARLRVIPGGRSAQRPEGQRPEGQRPVEPVSSVVRDDHTYCLAPKCPVCRPLAGTHGWACETCGARHEGFASEAAARADAAGHSCPPRNAPQERPVSAEDIWRCQYPVSGADGGRCSEQTRGGFRYCETHLAVVAAEERRRCMIPDPTHENGVCGLYTVPGTNFCIHHQGSDSPVQALAADDPRWRCSFPTADGPCGDEASWNARYCYRHDRLAQDDLMDLAEATQTPAAGNPAGGGKERSTTVNLDATGPEEIRAAFAQTADTAGEKAEEITGLAGVLAEAADRFENLQMASSTVEHMREASEAFQAAKALLDNAQESLTNALADFNSKDGHVADTVADTGGNLANQEVLVGG